MKTPSRKSWLALVLLLAIVVAVFIVPRVLLTPGVLEGVMNGALLPASKNLYFVEVDDVGLSITGRAISVKDLELRIDETVLDSLGALGEAPAIRFRGHLDKVTMDGVDLFRLVLFRKLAAARFLVTHPEMEISFVEQKATKNPSEVHASDRGEPEDSSEGPGAPARNVNLATGEGLPYLAIGLVRIEDINARMVLVRSGDRRRQELESTLKGLSFELENLLVDPSAPVDLQRVAFSDDARLSFEDLHLELPGQMDLNLGPFSASSREEALRVERIEAVPQHSEEEFLRGAGPPGDRIEASAGPISFEGLDYSRIINSLDIRLTRGRIENLRIQVLSDKQRPAELTADPWMPHDIFQDLPVLLTVDTVQVSGASVVYSERGLKGRGTGSIAIDEISGTIQNISHDPGRMTKETPMILEATARLFGSVPVGARLRVPLLEPAPTMELEARASGFDLALANGILPALEGIRVSRGVVDTAWVVIEYGPRKATGSVVAIYRGLQIRMEDRDTGKQNIGQGVLSAAANIVLRGKNDPKPGKDPRVGRVDYEVLPDIPFFQVLWEAVSDGLVNLVR